MDRLRKAVAAGISSAMLGTGLGAVAATLAARPAAATPTTFTYGAMGFGDNVLGEMGNGTTNPAPNPTNVTGGPWKALARSGSGGAAVDTNGNVNTWGNNANGNLGNGTTGGQQLIPAALAFAATDVSGGIDHFIALKADGSVWSWGNDTSGQLGNGLIAGPQPTPAPVQTGTGTLTAITKIAAGWYHNLALDTGGHVWAWGSNPDGEVGNGSTGTAALKAAQVESSAGVLLGNVTAIAAGEDYSLALDNAGQVWAWGNNSVGQIGNPTVGANAPFATRVQTDPAATFNPGANLIGASVIVAGGQTAYAEEQGFGPGGVIWSWGLGTHGQLGDGIDSAGHQRGDADVILQSPGTPLHTGGTLLAAGDDMVFWTAQAAGRIVAIGKNADLGAGQTPPLSDTLFAVQTLIPGGTTDVVSLEGTTLASVPAQFSGTQISALNNPPVGQTNATQLTITNNGPGPAAFGSCFITGPAAADYSIPAGQCPSATYGVGSTTSVNVNFTPSALGDRPASVVIDAGLNAPPLTVPIDGQGSLATTNVRIAFQRGGNQVLAMNEDGSSPRPISAIGDSDSRPAVSPDGQRVAFVHQAAVAPVPGQIAIRAINGASSPLRGPSFVNAPCPGNDLSWSPDGTLLAFVVTCATTPSLAVIHVDGTGVALLTSAAGLEHPSWSPDGTQLVYDAGPSNHTMDIFKVTLDPTRTSIVGPPVTLRTGGGNRTPAWSPDGRLIAWDNSGQISVMQPDGTNQQTVTPTDGFTRSLPSWLPDSGSFVSTTTEFGGTELAARYLPGAPHSTGRVIRLTSFGNADAAAVSGKSFALTVDQPSTTTSPSQLPLSSLVLSPDAPNASSGPVGLGGGLLSNINLNGLGGGLLSNINLNGLGGGLLSNITLLGLGGGLLSNINLNGLGGGLLSNINLLGLPTSAEGGWPAILAGTPFDGQPLQSVRLLDVIRWAQDPNNASNPAVGRLQSVHVRDVDFTHSALSTAGIVPLFLGGTTFRQITPPAGSGFFCNVFEAEGFANCGQAFGGLDATVLQYEAAGGDLPSLTLNSMPVSAFDLSKSLLPGVNLQSVQDQVRLDRSPLGSILLNELAAPGAVVDCLSADCSASSATTLAQAADDGHLKSVATFGTAFLTNGSKTPIAHLGRYSLGEVVFTLLTAAQTPIDDMDLAKLHLDSYGGPASKLLHITLSDTFTAALPPAAQSASWTMSVTLPPSFVYVPGSATLSSTTNFVGDVPDYRSSSIGDPTVQGSTLQWAFGEGFGPATFPQGTGLRLDFGVRPGLTAGAFNPSATLQAVYTDANNAPVLTTTDATSPASLNQPLIGVGKSFVDAPATSPTPIQPDTAYLVHGPSAIGPEFFSVPVPTDSSGNPAIGARVQIRLSHMTNDNDLVVYEPIGLTTDDAYRPAPPSFTVNGATVAAPTLQTGAVEDTPTGVPNNSGTTENQVGNDVPIRTDLGAVAGVSASRGLFDEQVEVQVPVGAQKTDHFTVQISAFNGSISPTAFVLHTTVVGIPQLPDCAARSFPNPVSVTGPAGTPVVPNGQPGATRSLFLVSAERMSAMYGSSQMLQQLELFAQQGNVQGEVIDVEQDAATKAALNAWDANPCDVSLANAVTRAVNHYVDSLLPSGNDYALSSVVLVGSDEMLPHARILDQTDAFNERLYAQHVAFTEVSQDASNAPLPPKSNALESALANGYTLSDAPYGDLAPFTYPGGFVDVPQVAVARLVETPTDVMTAMSRFNSTGGFLDPTASLSAGYGSSGTNASAQQVDTALAAASFGGQPLARHTLLTDPPTSPNAPPTWTAADVTGALGPNTLVNVNGHYDHLTAVPDSGTQGNFATTPAGGTHNLQTGPDLTGSGIFSLSCHSGLHVSDVLISNPTASQVAQLADWPAEYAQKGAGFVLGSTGFGYAGNYGVGFGQKIVTSFAKNLNGGVLVGDAFRDATAAYFRQLGAVSVFDRKVLAETTLYGLPMYRLQGTPTPPPPPLPPAPLSPPAGGLPQSVTVTDSTAPTATPQPDGTTLYTVGGQDPQQTPNEPITARLSQDVTEPGLVATGVLITNLSSTTSPNVAPSISRAIADSTASETPLGTPATAFPTSLANVGTSNDSTGLHQSLNLLATQFQATGSAGGLTTGTERIFDGITAQVFYGPPSAASDPLPVFSVVHAAIGGGQFTAHATMQPDPTGATPIAEILVLYLDGTTWRSITLTQTDATRWAGSGPVTSTTPVQFFMQAARASGRVGVTTNKSVLYESGTPPTLAITTPGDGAVFGVGQPVTAQYSCTDSSGAASPACAGPVANGASLDTSHAGSFTFTVSGTSVDGGTTTLTHAYDVVAPTASLDTPPDQATYSQGQTVDAVYSCTNATTCVGTVPAGAAIDTASPGTKAFTVTATNAFGARSSVSHTYTVAGPTVTLTTPADGATYQQLQPVAAAYSCGNASGCVGTVANGANIDTSTPGQVTFTVTASTPNGATVSVTHTYTVVAPTVTLTTPPDQATYQQLQPVAASYTCANASTCAGPAANGANIDTSKPGSVTFTVTATNPYGASSSASSTYTVVAPTVTLTTPPQGATYDLQQAVAANYTCANASTCSGTVANGSNIDTGSAGSKVFTVTAGNQFGASSSVTNTYTVVAPTVTLTTPADGATYQQLQPVPADYTCANATGCVGNVANGANIDTSTPGSTTFTVTATNAEGASTSVTHSYTVVAPTATLTTPADGATYQQLQPVAADYSCANASTCVGTVANGNNIDTSKPGQVKFTVTVTNAYGESTSVTHTYTVVAPTASITTPPDGASYQQLQPVAASYSCANASTCVGDVTNGTNIDTSKPGPVKFTVTATNAYGAFTTVSSTYTVLAPTATVTTPSDGATYDLLQPVAANYTCANASTCVGTVANGTNIDTSTPGSKPFTVTAKNIYGATSSVAITYNVVAPTASLTTPPDGALYGQLQPVAANYACANASSCVANVANGANIDTSTPGSTTFTVTASNPYGATASVTHSYTVVAPTVTSFASPPDGAVYIVHQPVTATYSCGDASAPGGTAFHCAGPAASGATIDTGSAGVKHFTVTATNQWGASVSVTHSYSVEYHFQGFNLLVANPPAVNTYASLLPILFNFKLTDWFNQEFKGLSAGNVNLVFVRQPCGAGTVPPTVTRPLLTLPPINIPVVGSNLEVSVAGLGVSGTCQQARLTLFGDPVDLHTANFNFIL